MRNVGWNYDIHHRRKCVASPELVVGGVANGAVLRVLAEWNEKATDKINRWLVL